MIERLKIRDTMAEPPAGWIVRNPEDDAVVRAPTYTHLLAALREYRRGRSFPIGSNFEADAQNWMCQDFPEDYCQPVERFDPETASLAQKAWRMTRALTRWANEGFPVVSTEVREERMGICASCPYYRANGNMGLGQCTAPGCGCTKIKLWLETSRCNFPGGSKWVR